MVDDSNLKPKATRVISEERAAAREAAAARKRAWKSMPANQASPEAAATLMAPAPDASSLTPLQRDKLKKILRMTRTGQVFAAGKSDPGMKSLMRWGLVEYVYHPLYGAGWQLTRDGKNLVS